MKSKNLGKRFSCGLLAGALVLQGLPLTTVNAAEVKLDSEVGETVLRTEEQPFGENVALGKKVYVGPGEKTGTASNVTDGNIGNGWQDSKNKSETDWCVVDLGQEYVIDKLNVFQDAGVKGTYQMYVADGNTVFDGMNFDSDKWIALGEEQTNATEDNYTFPQTKVRYIGYQSVTNTSTYGVNIKEIEAYTVGTTEAKELTEENLALNKTIDSSTEDIEEDSVEYGREAENLLDGDESTYWQLKNDKDKFFIVDLGEKMTFNTVTLLPGPSNYWAKKYTLSVSNDNEEWTTVYTEENGTKKKQYCNVGKQEAQYIKFESGKNDNNVGNGYAIAIAEVEVKNAAVVTPEKLCLNYEKLILNMADEEQKSRQLQFAVSPSNANNKEIVWSIEGKAATVTDAGLVTAVAEGKATVTATVKGTNVTESCEVEVTTIDAPTDVVAEHNEEEGKVTITWTKAAKAASYEIYSIKEGEAAKKIGAVSGQATSYTVNDDSISGGNYTYVVRAISSLGAKADSQPSNEIKILSELTGIKLKKTSLTMRANTTTQLSVTTTPAEDVKPYELVWEVVGDDIVTVENGMITAKAEGTTKIKVSVKGRADILPKECTIKVKEALEGYEAAPLPEDHVYGKNVAFSKEVTALLGDMIREKQNLVDGNKNTNFQLGTPEDMEQADLKQYYIIDLGQEYVIDTVNIFWQAACASEYQIQVAEAVDKNLSDEDAAETPGEGTTDVDSAEAQDESTTDVDAAEAQDESTTDEDATETPGEGTTDEDAAEAPDEVMPAVDDPDAWTTVAVEDDYQCEDREEKEHTFTPIKARYVKLNCSKAAMNYFFNIYEIEVYTVGRGRVEGNFTENLAKGAMIKKESEIENLGVDASKLVDGNLNSYWRPTNKSAGTEHFTLDLGEAKEFNIVKLIPAENVDRWAKVYTLSVSNDNEEWTTVYEENDGEHAEKYCVLDDTVTAQYLKFECKGVNQTDGWSIAIAEVEIYNSTGIETKGITVGPGTMTLTDYEPTKNITAVVNPINADKRTVVYESADDSIASVDENTGAVTGLTAGQTTVKATVKDTDISAEITVIVKKAIDKAANVKASMEKKTDHDVTITWDKVETAKSYTVQRVSQETTETVAEGLTENTYTDKDVLSGTYTYQIVAMPIDEEYSIFSISEMSDEVVVPVDVTSVAVKDITVKIGDTEKFAVTVTPKDATYPNVTYSVSDNDIISIDEENGTVTGLKEGTIEVKVTATDYPAISDTCTVTVEKVPVTGITLVSEDIKDNTLGLDEEGTLTAVIAPENASYKGVTWKSSEPEVATVNETGKVTPHGIGTVTITAISNDDNTITATYPISVIQKKVQEVTLDIQEKTLVIGESFDLTATVKPETAVDKEVEWNSSEPKVAEVNAEGKVTAIAEGTADITVTTKDGKKVATCKVKVEKPAATEIVLNSTKVELEIGETEVLTATVMPSDADQTVTFKPENPDIATVDAKGIITAVAEGTTDITVTTKDGEITATCKVRVKKPAATGVTLNSTKLELEVGETAVLKAIVSPSKADQTVLFNPVNDKIVDVDINGVVTAVAEGTTTIIATTVNGVTAECMVTVTNVAQTPEGSETQTPEESQVINPVEQLTVSKVSVAAESRPYGIKTIYLNKNAKLKLKATVTGSEGIDTKVTYTTSNKSVASVSSSGQIKAGKKTGTAVITVASVFDPTKTATVKVKVVDKAAPNTVLKLKKTKLSLKAKGEQAQIQLKKYTKTTTDTISYKVVSGKKYIKVDKYGVITSKANPGKKALTAKVQVTCGSKKVEVTVTIPKA